MRGGSWHEPPANCRSALRMKFDPGEQEDYTSFRVILEAA
jgi:formylglycine-generating enzyme required for sulfatase activity